MTIEHVILPIAPTTLSRLWQVARSRVLGKYGDTACFYIGECFAAMWSGNHPEWIASVVGSNLHIAKSIIRRAKRENCIKPRRN